MRPILFRGKRLDTGDWVFGDLITKPIHHDCVILENGCINHSVNSSTVGQFAGLKDKNGKDIYEGDIVYDGIKNRAVKWSSQNAGFYMSFTANGKSYYTEFIECGQWQSDGPVHCDTIIVVGNVHENADLLHPTPSNQ